MLRREDEVRRRKRVVVCLSLLCTALLVTSLTVAAASEQYGQVGEPWGSAGSGNGQFLSPGLFGVDSGDGSVYTGDITADKQNYRIQKLTSDGTFKGSVKVPRILSGEKIVTLHGIGVDSGLHRFYAIEGCRLAKPALACRSFGSIFGARQILVYSTEPSSGTLVPAATAALPLPTGSETIYSPQAIAVDPTTHDLVILGEDINGHTLVQRFSSAGVAGPRFVDSADVLQPAGEEAGALVVAPDGTSYTLTGAPAARGATHTRAWRLPANLSKVEAVPGFAAAAESEGWIAGLLSPKSSPLLGGPQLAISADGGTLYWKESIAQSTPEEAGSALVRGFSLSESKTSVLYGGGEGRCAIASSEAGIGVGGGKLVVFDYGPEIEEGDIPPYGYRVLTFGPGGDGCPQPVTKLKVNGSSVGEVTVQTGATVSFDAGESEFVEALPMVLSWDFGDGSKEKVEGSPEEGEEPPIPAETAITHKFAAPGTYTVKLTVSLENSVFGNPAPIERTVHAEGSGPSQFALTVAKAGTGAGTVTSSPAGVNCGLICSHSFESGLKVKLTATPGSGSEFKGWSGACTGAGTCEVTMSAARSVIASFGSAPEEEPPKEEPPAGGGSGGGAPPAGGSPPPPAPQPKPLTPRQKAMAKCKKLKGKARAKCVKKAKSIGKHKARGRRGRAGS